MRLAIIDDNEDIFVEYDPEVFKKLLLSYSQTMPIDKAFENVVEDLKNLTRRK